LDILTINTGQTLSVFASPGQDSRIPTTKSESIFTFGSFRMERNFNDNVLTGDSRSINFNNFSTLETLDYTQTYDQKKSFSVSNNELNLKENEPNSYAYFGSFYSTVALAINNILENFPYALLGNQIIDYSNYTTGITIFSSFKIPYSSITNQGDIIINTGSTQEISLVNNINNFSIQLSGSNIIYDIVDYKYIAPTGNTPHLQFNIKGDLFSGSTATTFSAPIYIRPSEVIYNTYLHNLSRLESQILLDGDFSIPNATIPDQYDIINFKWPKIIDGFNPDTYGFSFEEYQTRFFYACDLVDNDKTNIMFRTFFPENFIELDDEFNDIKSLAEVYTKEFDQIKQFIDGIAFAHSINYEKEESVSNKFLFKLSNLLGWELSSSFDETNMFEYLIGDIENDGSLSALNIEIWKRILVNIVWLYKKKGTRDALQFIFKLIGAPDCLINLNEFVYEIQKTNFNQTIEPDGINNLNETGPKINENGYINYDDSNYIFQEGGVGRGDGQVYIDQWKPEFNPIKKIDNIKTTIGNPDFFGTQNIMNTKELEITISPAAAIECDVYDWLTSTGTTWLWGTTSVTFAFSSLTVPFELLPLQSDFFSPHNLSGLTFSQFLDHIYANLIDPRIRKTIDHNHTSYYYFQLRNLYLWYYYSTSPLSNRLNFKKLEYYISLLEIQFQNYFLQLIPATSIFQGTGTEYRNTIFNRQKFVYKEGINSGSEFKIEFIPPLESPICINELDSEINKKFTGITNIICVQAYQPTKFTNNVIMSTVSSTIPNILKNKISVAKINSTVTSYIQTANPYL